MKNKVIGRYVYLCCGLIAIIVLCFVVTTNANEDINVETRDVNEKYTIRRIKEVVNNVTIYYPKVEDMADKDAESEINNNIKEAVSLFRSMSDNGTLISIDYKAAYKGTDYLSFVFKGMMKINESEMELLRSLTLNISNGKKMELTDLISKSTFSNANFKELVSNKLKVNGYTDKYSIDENSRFYLEKNLKSYSYVFYFLTDTNSKYYLELRILKDEIANAIKPSEDVDEETKKDDNNGNEDVNDEQNGKLQIDIIELDKKNEEFVSDKIFINEEEVKLDDNEKMFLYNDRIFIPLNTVATKLGYKTEVIESLDVKVYNDSEYVTLTIDEDRFFYGLENPFKLGEKTTIKNDIVFVPVELFSAVLKKNVSVKNNTLYISNRE